MDANGWIRVHRSIAYHWIWDSPKHFQRWVDMLFMASWEKKTIIFNKHTVVLKRGQLVTSNRQLQRRWGTNSKGVNTFLNILADDGMIICEKNKCMTLISIINYDKFQATVEGAKKRKTKTVSTPKFDHVSEALNSDLGQRKGQHLINNNKNINNISSTLTREEEEKFFEELKSSEIFRENFCKALKCEEANFFSLLDDFIVEMRAVEKIHNGINDCKTHFLNWAKIAISKKQNNNGNGKATNPGAAAEDKYANRRGVEPSAVKEKNFKSGF